MKRVEQEKEEERFRIFESDKRVYDKIKIDITKEKISENNIPELFATKYPIFKFMDLNNLLNTDNDYDTYKSLYDNIKGQESNTKEEYIPHNVHYPKNKLLTTFDESNDDSNNDDDSNDDD